MTAGNNIRSLYLQPLYPAIAGTNFSPYALLFSAIVSHFDNHPSYQRISSFYGIKDGLKGFGFNPPTRQNTVGDCAWAVWRAKSASVTYDIALTFRDLGTYPSGSWKNQALGDITGLGIAMAFHSSSVAWNGSITNNGNDSFTAGTNAPWKTGSIIFPRANAPDGGNNVTRNSVYDIAQIGNDSTFGLFISTDDEGTFVGFFNGGLNGTNALDYSVYIGTYEPFASSSMPVPLTGVTFLNNDADICFSGSVLTPGVKTGLIKDTYSNFNNRLDLYYNDESREIFEEHPVILIMDDNTNKYYCGKLHNINAVPLSTNKIFYYNANTRMVFVKGNEASNNMLSYSIPWQSTSVMKETI